MKSWTRLVAGLLLTMLLASSCAGIFSNYTEEEEEAAWETQKYNESREGP
jgi:hypothetical protein